MGGNKLLKVTSIIIQNIGLQNIFILSRLKNRISRNDFVHIKESDFTFKMSHALTYVGPKKE